MLLVPLCVILRRMMHISVLIFEGLFRLHKCARNGPDRHSGPHEQFFKDAVKRAGRLSETLSERYTCKFA